MQKDKLTRGVVDQPLELN